MSIVSPQFSRITFSQEVLMQASGSEKAEQGNPENIRSGQICPHCGVRIPDDVCGRCGYPHDSGPRPTTVSDEPSTISQAQTQLVEEARPCPNCGVTAPDLDGEFCGQCHKGCERLTEPGTTNEVTAERLISLCQACHRCPSLNPNLCPGQQKPTN